jgi:hypothetical protein
LNTEFEITPKLRISPRFFLTNFFQYPGPLSFFTKFNFVSSNDFEPKTGTWENAAHYRKKLNIQNLTKHQQHQQERGGVPEQQPE